MYSRSYKNDGEVIMIPESYSGIAFREPDVEKIPEDAPKSLAKSADIKFTTSPAPPDPNLTAKVEAEESVPSSAGGGFLSSVFDKIPFLSTFSGLSSFDLSKFKLPKVGTEEILIIGLAIFLFLSKDGDKECALLLLLLLLVQ